MQHNVHIAPTIFWCHDSALTAHIAALFIENINASYISHSELQYGRAESPDTWSERLPEAITEDIAAALSTSAETAHLKLAMAKLNGSIAAAVLISIDTDKATSHPFATIEDLIVTPVSRGHGIGQHMLGWLSMELRMQGIQRLFLESGINNHSAHEFFHKQGFNDISVVMMKEIG